MTIRLRLLLATASTSLVLLAVACGGATNTDLLGAPDETSTNPTDPGASSSGSTNGSNTSSSSSSSGNPPSTSSSTSSSSGASSSSSSSTSSTSSSGGSSGTTTKDGGTTVNPTPTLFCGSGSSSSTPGGPTADPPCSPKSDVCCGYNNGGSTISDLSCESKDPGGNNCFGGIVIGCDDRSDCSGNEMCCGSLDNNSNAYTGVQCSSTCQSTSDVRAVIFCDPKASPSQCPSGQTCGESGTLIGFHVCKT